MAFSNAEFPSLVVLYESPEIFALDKPVGVASIPGSGGSSLSLREQLEAHAGQKIYVVHRLDKEVSGVILFARSAVMHRYLNDKFSAREVKKVYRALVHGRGQSDRGTIAAPLREFGSGRVGVDHERGKPSFTAYRVIERGTCSSLLEVYPETGRRHQIRVHLYSIGHPILGDLRYGERALQERFPRLMLHACSIECRLPDGTPLRITSSVPFSETAL